MQPEIDKMIETGGYRGSVRTAMETFRDEIAPKIIIGLYRAWEAAPP